MHVEPDCRLVVIGIQGAMGSGKSTIRKYLQEKHRVHWVPMSGALKRALVAMGADTDDIYNPARKNEPNPLFCGRTNRYVMQTIGTEWGRELMGPDIWVNCAKKEVQSCLLDDLAQDGLTIVVFDDIRFPNECRMVRDFGGTLWIVRRPEVEPSITDQNRIIRDHARGIDVMNVFEGVDTYDRIHPSERWWMISDKDFEFENTGTEEKLLESVDMQLLHVLCAHDEKWNP